jgi:Rrf2 family protein
MIPLKRAGLVASTRGARGGYTLARKGITCGEVISASEGGLKIPCGKCKRNEECLTESFWHEMETLLSRIADSITMERLASDLALMVKGMGI